MASLKKTEANSAYSGGKVTFGLAFSAALASSVTVVSLVTRGEPAGINWELQHMIW